MIPTWTFIDPDKHPRFVSLFADQEAAEDEFVSFWSFAVEATEAEEQDREERTTWSEYHVGGWTMIRSFLAIAGGAS